MISKELAKKVRYIQIYTSKAVNDVLAGEYRSVFKGQGMEFEEVRNYQIGDEIRSIDWNVTARMGEPYVKRFREERELTVMFTVDLSSSGDFGSKTKLKNEVAAEICALLAFSAIKNNDKIGLIVFTESVELYIPPAKGTSHVLRLIRELLEFKPKKAKTNIAEAIDFLGKVTRKKTVIFLISDFLDSGYESALRVVGKRHDLTAISITDPVELEIPKVGLIELEDAETGEQIQVDTSSKQFRKQYKTLNTVRTKELQEIFRKIDIDQVEIDLGEDYLRELIRFFRKREKKMQ